MSIFQAEVPKRNPCCAQQQEPFAPGMGYWSVLLEGETGEVIRRDYCLTCWAEKKSEWLLGAKTHWKSRVPDKKEKEKNLNWKEKALAHLMDFLQAGREKEAFVFALLLARKRVLLFRKQVQEEQTVCDLYEVAATEQMVPIRSVVLSPAERDEMQNQLAKEWIS